jgi:hypothetical protein
MRGNELAGRRRDFFTSRRSHFKGAITLIVNLPACTGTAPTRLRRDRHGAPVRRRVFETGRGLERESGVGNRRAVACRSIIAESSRLGRGPVKRRSRCPASALYRASRDAVDRAGHRRYGPAQPRAALSARFFPVPGLGRSQVVRQRILIPPFGGSSPPAPASLVPASHIL